jgi:hypothetical protein
MYLSGTPSLVYRLGQITWGGVSSASAMILSTSGQPERMAIPAADVWYPWFRESADSVRPRLAKLALMSAGCQSRRSVALTIQRRPRIEIRD